MILNGEIIQEDSLEGELTIEKTLEAEISSEQSLDGEIQPFGQLEPYAHPDLILRDRPDQHPENAITNLAEDLAARPSEIITDSEIWNL